MNESEEPEAKLRSALSARAASVRVGDPEPGVKHRIGMHRRQRHRRIALGSAALAVVVAAGVLVPVLASRDRHTTRGAGASATVAKPGPTGVLKSQLVRDTRPAVPVAAVTSLANAGTQTALDLYGQLANTSGNVFFSPYSIETALGMAAAGARGNTLSQMLSVLHNRLSSAQFQDATNALNLALVRPRPAPADGQSGDPLQLEIANSEWSQSGFAVDPSFLNVLARDYGAGLNTVDFGRDPDVAVASINQWVAQHTNNKIKQLFDQLDPTTKLVLVNAVHFKASWETPFVPGETSTGNFTTASGKTVQVPLMHSVVHATYAAHDGWQAADLPYIGGASMTVVMPDSGTFASFERSLDAAKLGAVLGALRPNVFSLAMPKLQLTDHADLVPALRALGMNDAFDHADFSGIDGRRDLSISQVVHQATITVDEDGTEAAAATGIAMTQSAETSRLKLTLDHPYLFFIRDTRTGTILFMGRVTDPTQTSVQQP